MWIKCVNVHKPSIVYSFLPSLFPVPDLSSRLTLRSDLSETSHTIKLDAY